MPGLLGGLAGLVRLDVLCNQLLALLLLLGQLGLELILLSVALLLHGDLALLALLLARRRLLLGLLADAILLSLVRGALGDAFFLDLFGLGLGSLTHLLSLLLGSNLLRLAGRRRLVFICLNALDRLARLL